jgi:hypothetical protein
LKPRLAGGPGRLDGEELVAAVLVAEDVAERAAVRQVLHDEADLVHGVLEQAILERKKLKQ